MAEVASRIFHSALTPSFSSHLHHQKPPGAPLFHPHTASYRRIRCSSTPTASEQETTAIPTRYPHPITWGCEIDSLENAESLQRWLSESGLPEQKMAIDRVEVGERGLVALKNIRKGEKLLFVPPPLFITPDSEWSCPEAGEVLRRYSVPDWPLLATCLISEASFMSSSRWSNYIAALPRQPYSLLYWTRSELDRSSKKMLASASLISCNFSPFLSSSPSTQSMRHTLISFPRNCPKPLNFPKRITHFAPYFPFPQKGALQICSFSKGTPNLEDPVAENESTESNGSGGGNEVESDWTTSILLFLLWAALMYYVFNLTPDQTPSRDEYFLKKLLNLKGDDGFRMNDVLVALWYIMGLWPIVYSMLLLPTGRSSKSSIPVWPFPVLSFFGGAYILLPYFILWRPPPPPIAEDELQRWPLNFLESKITAGVLGAAGLGLIIYAGLATGDWKEFLQYFRESKLVHVTSIDFMLLSAFAPFWIYNDMTARKCFEKYSWLLPFSVIPFVGPSLYLLLRPLPPTVAMKTSPKP